MLLLAKPKSDAIESVETRFTALRHGGDHAAAAIHLLTFKFFCSFFLERNFLHVHTQHLKITLKPHFVCK